MKIRKATKKEFEDYSRLRKESTKEYSKISGEKIILSNKLIKERFKELLSSPKRLLLFAGENDKKVGYLAGEFFKRFGYVDDVFTSKRYRNKDIATSLIKEFSNKLKRRKIKKLRLGVNIKNKKAILLYKKLGFKLAHYEMDKELK